MRKQPYYSVRAGKNEITQIPHETMLELFFAMYCKFRGKGYFTESMGYTCQDAGRIDGNLGHDIDAAFFFNLRKNDLWPIDDLYKSYDTDDLFDVMEFLYDCSSKPTAWWYHDWNGCGNHYTEFHKSAGMQDYRDEANRILNDYAGGYELSVDGEILSLPHNDLANLIEAPIPERDEANITLRIKAATLKFRRRSSSDEERRDAIRDLADVLEFIKPQLQNVLKREDESALFNIANNFGIRHHNSKQKNDYDKAIWYSWMFYFYLATIHASLRLIEKSQPLTG